ncbi:MAG: hypothetical protein H6909_03445 [Rickettsiaceae bacterium]|nr:hypothetical protein [Rickettsiaceae bacterium]
MIPCLCNGSNILLETKIYEFDNKNRRPRCNGKISYPQLIINPIEEQQELYLNINKKIEDIVKEYSVCNKTSKNSYSAEFEVPNSGVQDLFSILWRTKKHNKTSRIESITINIHTGEILKEDNIFHNHSSNLIHELVKLSKDRLNMQITWDEFLKKIENKEIQLYLKNGEWFIVFNDTTSSDNIFETTLPRYFIRYRQIHDK